MNNFSGYDKRKSYFEGWYLKHQKEDEAISFIPSFHIDKMGRRTVSIQVITKEGSYHFPFAVSQFSASRRHFCVKIENNVFSEKGISVNLKKDDFSVSGTLHYSPFQTLDTDIMGPFRYVPFMQCRHGVLSMTHALRGILKINGKKYDFSGGTGYVEKDFGTSFPISYVWTQCSDWNGNQDSSLMISTAHIPFGPVSFKGCICAVWYQGKEYRLATYCGARIVKGTKDSVEIRQGRYCLTAEKKKIPNQKEEGKELLAPKSGSMERVIKENIACRVHYCLRKGKKVIFDFTSENASYEAV